MTTENHIFTYLGKEINRKKKSHDIHAIFTVYNMNGSTTLEGSTKENRSKSHIVESRWFWEMMSSNSFCLSIRNVSSRNVKMIDIILFPMHNL